MSNGYERQPTIRDELEAVYRRDAPDLLATTFVLRRTAMTLGQAHAGPIESCGRYGPVEERSFKWEHTYTRHEWVEQLPTHSDHRTLPPHVLAKLLEHIGEVIDAHGGTLRIGYTTQVLLATRL